MDAVDRIVAQWHAEKPGLATEPMALIGRIKRLAHHLNKGMDRALASHGLNLASFDVLATLRRSGKPYALSPGDLLNAVMVTSGTMTHRIDQLEKAGLVERARSLVDARSLLVRLTPHGMDVIEAAITDHVEAQAQLVATLPAGQRTQLDGLLKSLLAAFEGSE